MLPALTNTDVETVVVILKASKSKIEEHDRQFGTFTWQKDG
jgi:hypothetical protein